MDMRVTLLLLAEALLALFFLYREGLLSSRGAWLAAVLLLAGAMGLRAAVLDYETLDYQQFLSVWVEHFRNNGGFRALASPIGNYNIPYLYFLALFSYSSIRDLYLIKLLSILFDLLLAWACARICRRFSESVWRRLGCFFMILYLPTVFLNGAVWGQCDSIYVALAVWGFVLALEDKPIPSMLCIALSFGFKLQAVFLMPIYAVLWMYGKFNWKHFLLFPLFYVLLVLPAVALGRPFLDTLTLYASQADSVGEGLNYNSPSIFAFFYHIEEPERASLTAILAALAFTLNLLAAAFVKRGRLNDRAVLCMALLFALGVPFLLPHMHDRYFFGAGALSVALAFSIPVLSPAAALVQFASYLGYHAYLKMRFLLLMHNGAAALLAALAITLAGMLYALRGGSEKDRARPPARAGGAGRKKS